MIENQKEKPSNMSDEELFKAIAENHWQGACMIELTRRSIGEYRDIFRRANQINTWLTIILVILTIVLTILAFR